MHRSSDQTEKEMFWWADIYPASICLYAKRYYLHLFHVICCFLIQPLIKRKHFNFSQGYVYENHRLNNYDGLSIFRWQLHNNDLFWDCNSCQTRSRRLLHKKTLPSSPGKRRAAKPRRVGVRTLGELFLRRGSQTSEPCAHPSASGLPEHSARVGVLLPALPCPAGSSGTAELGGPGGILQPVSLRKWSLWDFTDCLRSIYLS